MVVQHCTRRATELKEEERARLNQSSLNRVETTELAKYEEGKRFTIQGKKEKKCQRDGVLPTSGNHANPPLNKLINQTEASRESPQNIPEVTNVVNLSKEPLTTSQIQLLSKGLTFCPTSGKIDEFQLYQDLDNFARTLRLKEYFLIKIQHRETDHLGFPIKHGLHASNVTNIWICIFQLCKGI